MKHALKKKVGEGRFFLDSSGACSSSFSLLSYSLCFGNFLTDLRWLTFRDLTLTAHDDTLASKISLLSSTWINWVWNYVGNCPGGDPDMSIVKDSIEIPQKEILLVLFSEWFWKFIWKPGFIGIVLKVTFIFWISKRSFKCLTGRTTRGPTRPISAKFHGVKSTCQSWIVNWFENFWLPKKIDRNWNPHN